jgi:hypothetical protein
MIRQEAPATALSKTNLNDQKSKKSFKAFWWIALKTSAKVAMFQEKPLDSLPRLDPLYGVLRNSSSL